jgi:hypothetical protein
MVKLIRVDQALPCRDFRLAARLPLPPKKQASPNK